MGIEVSDYQAVYDIPANMATFNIDLNFFIGASITIYVFTS